MRNPFTQALHELRHQVKPSAKVYKRHPKHKGQEG